MFVMQRNGDGPKSVRSFRNLLSVLSIILGTGVTFAVIAFSPSPSSRHALVNAVLHSKVADIDEIDLQPCPGTGHTPLTAVSITVRQRGDIANIAEALNHVLPFSPSHPEERWSTLVTIRTKVSEYQCTVSQANDATNGTLIVVTSGVATGWTIGTFRSDSLGDVLERLVRSR
jgi:hypothetical protein